ncbi:nucleotidyltransferase [Cryobacterium sp. TmT2-59]|nr:nucleotidyltransferase [Cryobacterium sp. TmT2-59]
MFDGLLDNLRVDNSGTLAMRRDQITKVLNREFRYLDDSTNHKLMVGSYGRWTAIKGISDLDLLFILPPAIRGDYNSDGDASRILSRTREAIQARYPGTSVTVDRLVVVVEFANFMFEVQPVFVNDDESFSYPDTYADGWKITKPREEISAMRSENLSTKGNLRQLCKLARAWKNKHGVALGGLLIDTLAYNFMTTNPDYRSIAMSSYDEMVRDFFLFLAEQPDQERYLALGSRQHVRVKKKFQRKAKKAYDLSVEAIEAEGQKNVSKKWRAVFGNSVPIVDVLKSLSAGASPDETEEFIEDQYYLDVRYDVTIDCTVTQDGFRPHSLRDTVRLSRLLPAKKELTFKIIGSDVPEPFDVRWKVLNRGPEAERRKSVRGQIIESSHGRDRREVTSFRGRHLVECYIVRNGVVVARDDIEVPISSAFN